MDNLVGRVLGNRYELVEKIGGGGMAIVYKAKCKLLNRFVAVKILRTDSDMTEDFIKRFKVERSWQIPCPSAEFSARR